MNSTRDTLLKGRVQIVQPTRGFRANVDSLLLSAALPDIRNGKALEFGSGCGGAFLCAGFRLPDAQLDGIEIDPDMAKLTQQGIDANGFAPRMNIHIADATDWVKTRENEYNLVFANPPYFPPGTITKPRSDAYFESVSVDTWVKAMLFAAKPKAPIVIIHRAAQLSKLLVALDRRAGDITVLPIHSKAENNASRVLVRARKGLRAGDLRLLPALVLQTGAETSSALARLQSGAGIDW